ncbi:MAG: ThiF family adenylyltransferase [Acidimicrobiales bacterium]
MVLDREGHDRDIRALGEAGARALASLRVGVVGVGGTGSAVVEMPAWLGVRDFVLVDPDNLERSNLSRVFGSSPTDVGDAKVTVAAAAIRRIAPDARVRSVKGSVVDRVATLELADRDVVFGCTDDHLGRLVLGRLPTWLLRRSTAES